MCARFLIYMCIYICIYVYSLKSLGYLHFFLWHCKLSAFQNCHALSFIVGWFVGTDDGQAAVNDSSTPSQTVPWKEVGNVNMRIVKVYFLLDRKFSTGRSKNDSNLSQFPCAGPSMCTKQTSVIQQCRCCQVSRDQEVHEAASATINCTIHYCCPACIWYLVPLDFHFLIPKFASPW